MTGFLQIMAGVVAAILLAYMLPYMATRAVLRAMRDERGTDGTPR